MMTMKTLVFDSMPCMTNNYFNYSFLVSTCTGLPLPHTCMLTILELLLELCIPSNNEQCDQCD